MKIKAVEEKTGLSVKSIRYYEEKGLIDIERNSENDYREFDEEDVITLKFIKILRYADFRIDEIKSILDNSDVSSILQTKIAEMDNRHKEVSTKKDICKWLQQDFKKRKDMLKFVEDFGGIVEFYESDDWGKIKKVALKSHLWAAVYASILLLGPVGMFFIYFVEGNYAKLPVNMIIAVLQSSYVAFLWTKYFYYWKREL